MRLTFALRPQWAVPPRHCFRALHAQSYDDPRRSKVLGRQASDWGRRGIQRCSGEVRILLTQSVSGAFLSQKVRKEALTHPTYPPIYDISAAARILTPWHSSSTEKTR